MSGNTAISYARVSTHEQSTAGISLDVQLQALKVFAGHEDLQLTHHFMDIGSARTLDRRPELARALRHLAEGHADCLLITTLDRLTRSREDFDDLVSKYFVLDKTLFVVSEGLTTTTDLKALRALADFAQAQSASIGSSTSAAMQYKAGRGEYTGGKARYGFRVAEDGVKLVPVASEQQALSIVRELHQEGYSLREIANTLTKRGHRSRTGRTFGPSSISRFVKVA